MCVAAALFKSGKHKLFKREWEKMLRSMGNKPYFHATDFFPGGGIYKDLSHARRAEIAKQLPQLIDDHVHQVCAVSVKADEFDARAPLEWRKKFGSLHAVAAQMCAGVVGRWANERGYTGPIAYFIEAGDEDEGDVNNRFKGLSWNATQAKHIRYYSHSFIPKGSARGLEVADYFAWHWNKLDAETLSRVGEDDQRPWRKDFRALVDSNHKKYKVIRLIGASLDEFLISQGCHLKNSGDAPEPPSDSSPQ